MDVLSELCEPKYYKLNLITTNQSYRNFHNIFYNITQIKSYLINRTMQMDGGSLFAVNTDYVSSCLDKIWHSLFGFHNHLQYIDFT